MYEFLDRIRTADLLEFLSGKGSKRFHRLDACDDRDAVRNVLFSIYGFDLLYQNTIRRMLLLTLPEDELRLLAKKFKLRPEGKRFDVALRIAGLQWRVNGKIVSDFHRVFQIPVEFLPDKSRQLDAVEIVEPYSCPPPLFDYQEDLVDAIVSELRNDTSHACLVQLPTGTGKTRVAMQALASYLNIREEEGINAGVLWLAHTEELCEQAVESFRRVWQADGQFEKRVIRYWGDYSVAPSSMLGAFTVGGYVKVANLFVDRPHDVEEPGNLFLVVVIDEAHKALAPTIKRTVQKLCGPGRSFLLGLTATPGRSMENTGENIALARLFGKKLLSSERLGRNPIKELQDQGILARIRHSSTETNISLSLSDNERELTKVTSDLPGTFLNRLAENEKRNDLITSIVEEQIKQGNPTLVFSCTVQHAKTLAAAIAFRGYRAAAIDCRMRRGLRRRVINAFKNNKISAIFNYGVLSTGFDAPNIKTIVIARPTGSVVLYAQMIGRGLRGEKVGGTKECTLVDIKDNFDNFGGVQDVYLSFKRFWKK